MYSVDHFLIFNTILKYLINFVALFRNLSELKQKFLNLTYTSKVMGKRLLRI